MDELNISKRTDRVTFTVRVDKTILEYYEELAEETNRSRNEVISLALEFAMDKINIKD